MQLVSRSIPTQSWGWEQNVGSPHPDSHSTAQNLPVRFWSRLIVVSNPPDCISHRYWHKQRLSCLVWALLGSARADPVCVSCVLLPAQPCPSLPPAQRDVQHHPCPASSGGLWGALLYVTKAQPCKCHSWPSNVHVEGTDLSPSPNSLLVSSVQGRHELEEIMARKKSLR